MTTKVTVQKTNKEAVLPYSKYISDAGKDVVPILEAEELVIKPFSIVKLKTGLKVDIRNRNSFIDIRERSSIFIRGLVIRGVIDSGYTEEIFLLVRNVTDKSITIKKGERIAQFLQPVILQTEYIEGEVKKKDREGGLGSTGKY